MQIDVHFVPVVSSRNLLPNCSIESDPLLCVHGFSFAKEAATEYDAAITYVEINPPPVNGGSRKRTHRKRTHRKRTQRKQNKRRTHRK